MSGMNGRGSSALVDSIVSGDREGVGGILCNDPQGLCVASKGSLADDDSGVFTNLVRLAAQLPGGDQAPLIMLETADKAILVKDYAGYAVAVQIPKKSTEAKEEGES